MTADRVAMIDCNEPHVDVPDLDLALPHNAVGLGNDAYDIAAQARAGWEAAVCWDPSGTDQFAVGRCRSAPCPGGILQGRTARRHTTAARADNSSLLKIASNAS
jgi:hypothetical protein